MIKTYHHGDNSQLSTHFKASEFQCKCGKGHDFQIDDELISKLEAIFDALDCSSITISSGFRCAAHDKSVGGSGTGQHTLGRAADFCCFDAAGKAIVSYRVCCAAQDSGLRGIARINDAYTHCDTRTGGIWYGDETKGSSYCIPCKDFYEYFNIPREDAKGMNGIDVSVHNGEIDWSKVKAAGVEFAILRAGFGKVIKQKDERFEQNYAGAKAAGIPVGAYWYSYAKTVEEAKQEAAACIEVLKGKQFEFPIWFDQEEKDQFTTGKENCSAMIRAFCDELEAAGYWAGLYTSRSILGTHIEDDIKTRYALWVAEWGSKLNYSGTVGMWQRSSKGSVPGIRGDVDLDTAYKDYPSLIKAKGLNGYGKISGITVELSEKTDNEPDSINVKVEIGGATYEGPLIRTGA